MFNAKSDWAFNKKDKDAIIYVHNGEVVRITVETFVRDGHTAAEYQRFKAESDALFYEEDKLDVTEGRYREPLEGAEQSGKYAAKSPEDMIVEHIDRQIHKAYLETLKPLAKKALDKLTAIQRRRYLLHVCEGLTTRRIADIEGVAHQSVVESLQAADKKIKKIIGNT